MSTREERRLWQEFREKHGISVNEFKKRWRKMFEREPKPGEIDEYVLMRTRLRANLGRKKKVKMPPITVTRRFEWDMGHRLPNHNGKCARLHGHRYAMELDVTADRLTNVPGDSSEGMVIDFGDLDKVIDQAIGYWDHRTMLYDDDGSLYAEGGEESLGVFRVPFIPTAENLCLEVLKRLQKLMVWPTLHITRIRIYETPKSWAEVHPWK